MYLPFVQRFVSLTVLILDSPVIVADFTCSFVLGRSSGSGHGLVGDLERFGCLRLGRCTGLYQIIPHFIYIAVSVTLISVSLF